MRVAEVRSDCLLLELYNNPRDGQTVLDLVKWIRDQFDSTSLYFSDAAYGEFSKRLLERFRSLAANANWGFDLIPAGSTSAGKKVDSWWWILYLGKCHVFGGPTFPRPRRLAFFREFYSVLLLQTTMWLC